MSTADYEYLDIRNVSDSTGRRAPCSQSLALSAVSQRRGPSLSLEPFGSNPSNNCYSSHARDNASNAATHDDSGRAPPISQNNSVPVVSLRESVGQSDVQQNGHEERYIPGGRAAPPRLRTPCSQSPALPAPSQRQDYHSGGMPPISQNDSAPVVSLRESVGRSDVQQNGHDEHNIPGGGAPQPRLSELGIEIRPL